MTLHHDDLSGLLQSWKGDAAPDVDFNRAVWSRIEATERRKVDFFAPFLIWLQELTRPRVAVSAAAIALFGGILLGGLQARSAQEEQYLLSLSPYHAGSTLTNR